MRKSTSFPLFTRGKLVDVAKYVEPTVRHNRPTHGYAVGIVERNSERHTVLIPYEEFPKDKIPKFLNKEFNVKPTDHGLRTSLSIQDVKDLKEADELIAVNMQNFENRVNEKFEELKEWLIRVDLDLNKFREVFKIWNGYDNHSIPKD
mgnify:FL=1